MGISSVAETEFRFRVEFVLSTGKELEHSSVNHISLMTGFTWAVVGNTNFDLTHTS